MFNFKLIAMRKTLLLLCAIVLTLGVFAQRSKGNITVTTPPGWAKVQGSVLEHQYLKNGASFMIKEETHAKISYQLQWYRATLTKCWQPWLFR